MNLKALRNCKGMTLPVTLIIMLILFILGVSILSMSLAETFGAWHQREVTEVIVFKSE